MNVTKESILECIDKVNQATAKDVVVIGSKNMLEQIKQYIPHNVKTWCNPYCTDDYIYVIPKDSLYFLSNWRD